MKVERLKFLEHPDYIKLLKVAKASSSRNYILLLLMGELGLRVSEATNLRIADITDDGNYMTFRIGTLKQRGGKRPVQEVILGKLPSATVREYLKKHDYKPTDWIFRTYVGHLTRSVVFRFFKEYVKMAGLSGEYSPHSLRHYQGHRVFEATGSVDEVAKRLRHSKAATAYIYSHLSLKKQKEIADGRKQ